MPKKIVLHLMLYKQKIYYHWRNVKKNNKKNEIESRLKNNNINSRNKSRPGSGINFFSPKTYFFLDRNKNVIIKYSIQERIRLWREEIYTRFWPGLTPGINIIIIFLIEIQSHFYCCCLSHCSNGSKSFARRTLGVIIIRY